MIEFVVFQPEEFYDESNKKFGFSKTSLIQN